MSQWTGWADVTKGDTDCPAAIPNAPDLTSVTQTTRAINCRFASKVFSCQGVGSVYFPPGVYYMNDTLNLVSSNYQSNADGSYTYSGMVKHPSMVNIDGLFDMTFERITLDGQNCAGNGLDMTSFKASSSGLRILEMIFQNLREVALVGDRPDLTADEKDQCLIYTSKHIACINNYSNNPGMVSELLIEKNVFRNVKVGIGIGTFNALDYWVRDNLFDSCGIGITNSFADAGLRWGNVGGGAFDASNNIFLNSTIADMTVAAPGVFGIRGNYSVGSQGPFFSTHRYFSNYRLLFQDNTVVASGGIIPFDFQNTTNTLFLQNTIVTQNKAPGALIETANWYQKAFFPGASSLVTDLLGDTFSRVMSIGNTFSSTQSFVGDGTQSPPLPANAQLGGAGPLIQCSTGATTTVNGRTVCDNLQPTTPWLKPIFNLITSDDLVGVSGVPKMPALPQIRPEVKRSSIFVAHPTAASLQAAVNQMALQELTCSGNDYNCFQLWSIIFLPQGFSRSTKRFRFPEALTYRL